MKVTGVHWQGPVYDMGGYGNVSRNYLRVLEAIGVPVLVESYGGGMHRAEIGEETYRWLQRLSNPRIGDRVVSIRHGVPPLFDQAASPIRAAKKVGITLFETDRLPQGWAEPCDRMDEVWVPTEFNRRTFAASGVRESKLKVLPYALDASRFYPGIVASRIDFAPPLPGFSFLYVFGFDYRKGFDLLIDAFCEEFSSAEKACLVLKVYVHSGYKAEQVMQEMRRCIPQGRLFRQIFVILEPFDDRQLLELYQACDAYVSVDRAGWGMPAMEMMALGKPVIGLDWGGYTEFMDDSNGLLIRPEKELVPVDARLQRDRPDYYLHHRWADIRPQSVGAAMRRIYEDEELRARIARKAAFDIHMNFSIEAVGVRMRQLLQLG
ncbi:glycosyltransferase family 4 protein [Cohnella fermenti]|uniref:Glycosyltransferase family 4 protein n=1 Tax=Cohnella fermenti TaxID=2565925 RepID=A0A4S4BV99_9BACL|nr:glycosyltransferase family 4 protein [Cohnella fermenti]THF79049.1 glycosyltransferase family 4 protein [Cohnella fermenti]